jgi:formate dehydrogenase major subunit
MVVLPGELEQLLEEGGNLRNECAPTTFLASGGKLSGIRFVRTRPAAAGRGKQRQPVPIPGSEFELECDAAILATGQFPDCRWIDGSLAPEMVGKDGWLTSGNSQLTAHRKIFAAGDFALGATTLIQAIGHAKRCAAEVDRFLSGTPRLRASIAVSASFQSKTANCATTGRKPEMNAIPLHPMPTLPLDRRGFHDEVETGFEQPQALMEASRCYLCHYKFEIVDEKCVLCDECLKVKPVPDCIVEVSALLRDDDGRINGYRRVEEGRTDSLYYNRLWIDQSRCVRCGQCEAVCPVNAITIQKVSLETKPATSLYPRGTGSE